MTPARAEEVAGDVEFGLPLASASDDYQMLGKYVQEVSAAAKHFRSEWQDGGDRDCLAKAQGLSIKGMLLDSLHALRAHHKDWLSSTPVVSPATMAYLLPFFSDALHVCETARSDPELFPKLFPIAGFDGALKHMRTQVDASRQSLAAGQWQATAEGQWHAEKVPRTAGLGPRCGRPRPDRPIRQATTAFVREHPPPCCAGMLTASCDPDPGTHPHDPQQQPVLRTFPQRAHPPRPRPPRHGSG